MNDSPDISTDEDVNIVDRNLTIRVIKPFSWKDSFSKYPKMLASADSKHVYTTQELYEDVLGTAVPYNRPIVGQNLPSQWTLAFLGLEPDVRTNSCQVRGLGFAQLTKDTVAAGARKLSGRWTITEMGRRLGEAYRDDPRADTWKVVFAEAVARRDPFTRVVLSALGSGAVLRFSKDGPLSFGAKMGVAELVIGGETMHPFAQTRRRVKSRTNKTAEPRQAIDKANHPFVRLMRAHPSQTVGPFLLRDMEGYDLDTAQPLSIAGPWSQPGRNMRPDPSVNEIDLYLHQSLSLFVEIGTIVHHQGTGWVADPVRARKRFPHDLATDLFPASDDASAFLEALEYAVADAPVTAEGLVEVKRVRRRVCEVLGVSAGEQPAFFNYQIAALWGRVGIGRSLGHTAPGEDCLFNDIRKQYVEFLL